MEQGVALNALLHKGAGMIWTQQLLVCCNSEIYMGSKLKSNVLLSNEIELFVVRWMDLETVIRSEASQKENNKYRMLTHIYGI